MLQKIRVIATLVVWFSFGRGGGVFLLFHNFECVVNFVSMSYTFLFSREINIQLAQVIGFCSFLHFLYDLALKKEKGKKKIEKKKSLSSGVCFVCSNMQTLYFLDIVFVLFFVFCFFWLCTFNLKCFLYLLDISVLPFLIGLYNFAMFYSLCFMVTVCSVRTKKMEAVFPLEWRLLFLWCSPPVFSLLIYIKLYLYL